MNHEPDVEAYLTGIEPVDIIRLLNDTVGPFVADGATDDGLRVFTGGTSKLVITPNIQDGFVSVWLRGEPRWRSDVDFARFLAVALQCRARCDPGADYPQVDPRSDVFVDIKDGSETLIVWR
ncbi:MAG TPA: hypothetical protein VFW22_09805 [Pseudolabrys sp.]|nr:hypothetical protein [Pseudolabrys sp.]